MNWPKQKQNLKISYHEKVLESDEVNKLSDYKEVKAKRNRMEIALKELEKYSDLEGLEEKQIMESFDDPNDNSMIMDLIKEKTRNYKLILNEMQNLLNEINVFANKIIQTDSDKKERILYAGYKNKIEKKILDLILKVNNPKIKDIDELKIYLNLNKNFDSMR